MKTSEIFQFDCYYNEIIMVTEFLLFLIEKLLLTTTKVKNNTKLIL